MTWLSERSGIASRGVVRSAQYPHPARSTKTATTRTRFLSDTSMSQLITAALRRPPRRAGLSQTVAGRRRRSPSGLGCSSLARLRYRLACGHLLAAQEAADAPRQGG